MTDEYTGTTGPSDTLDSDETELPEWARRATEQVEQATTAPEPESTEEADEPAAVAASDSDDEADDEDEDEDEDEDDAELAELDARFLPGDWYVVHTYAGYENKVKANLRSRIASMNMEDKIFDIAIPTEEVMEIKAGKKQLVEKKVLPGYILVRMMLDDDSWYVVRNTPGVTGFVGPGAKSTPLSTSEVRKLLSPKPTERGLAPRLEFEEGEVVSVISGAFNGMSGPIAELNVDQQKVKVLIDIFGRETPVELSFQEVAKL